MVLAPTVAVSPFPWQTLYLDEINGSKQMWTVAAFINFIGPIAYFTFGRKR